MINDLEISDIYVHADETVYSKLCHIMWKNPELYKCIVTLMADFQQLRVKQRLEGGQWKVVIITDACDYTGPIPIWESERLAIFLKISGEG